MYTIVSPLVCSISLPLLALSQTLDKIKREMKYILLTGGTVSGLGKGVTASSIGVVLKACGLRVTSIKIGLFSKTLH